MKIGFYYFATDYSMPIVEVARALEEHGYESLFVPEHTHIPASRRSPWPGGPELPKHYSHTLDPFVGLAAAAAVDQDAAHRHRHLSSDRARPDRDREGGRDPRSDLGRALRVRHRRRLERRGDGEPRHRGSRPAFGSWSIAPRR